MKETASWYLLREQITPAQSWQLLDWCRQNGADTFTLSLVAIEGGDTDFCEYAETVLSPPFRLEQESPCSHGDEHVKPTSPLPWWRLDEDACRVLKSLLPGGVLMSPTYSSQGWIEDPRICRAGTVLLEVVSHEGMAVLFVPESGARELLSLGIPLWSRTAGKPGKTWTEPHARRVGGWHPGTDAPGNWRKPTCSSMEIS